jgi:hypothetical protein
MDKRYFRSDIYLLSGSRNWRQISWKTGDGKKETYNFFLGIILSNDRQRR